MKISKIQYLTFNGEMFNTFGVNLKGSLYMDDVKQNNALYHIFWNNPVWLI